MPLFNFFFPIQSDENNLLIHIYLYMRMCMNMIYFINDFLANFIRYECVFLPHQHVEFQLYIYVYITTCTREGVI